MEPSTVPKKKRLRETRLLSPSGPRLCFVVSWAQPNAGHTSIQFINSVGATAAAAAAESRAGLGWVRFALVGAAGQQAPPAVAAGRWHAELNKSLSLAPNDDLKVLRSCETCPEYMRRMVPTIITIKHIQLASESHSNSL